VAAGRADSSSLALESDVDGPSPALGAVLGYLSGDGNVYYGRSEGSYGVRFTNAEEELLAEFERACRAAFDAEPTRPSSERRADGVETVRLHGKASADAVLDAGMTLETHDRKAFPTAVSAGSRATKAAFVRALADAEGTVDTATGSVRVSSASEELLRGTRELLLEFGVSTRLRTRERSGKRDPYVLAVTDADSLAAYARHVGFTLDRKRRALDEVVDSASGDPTALDVIPDAGDLLRECREGLRLYRRECGLDGATYCAFESGNANVSLHRARRVLDAFEARRREAERDAEALASPVSWDRLATLRERYHVSQADLAAGIEHSRQRVSREWGEDGDLRELVRERLAGVVADVASTDLSELRSLVRGDVKWRRVASVEAVPAEAVDDRVPVLRERLADVLGGDAADAVERGRDLLADGFETGSRASLRRAMERHGVSTAAVARGLDVAGSTVSRWLSGAVETDRLPEVRAAATERIEDVRTEVRRLLDAVAERRTPRVYDLTVAGTHNFLANGMVVHNSEDRSAMHEALEQQQISVAKAGINATLKSRCSLLGAANPKYGRFDQYEPIAEQIDLEPALISRFDLIFTVTDRPDPDHDRSLAEHIIQTNYAGELNTQRTQLPNANYSDEEVESQTEAVAPAIEADLLRKYIAYAKRTCYPTMTPEAKELIKEFYVDFRSKGTDEDSPVPITARKLEALVRLAEASARVRLSDTVEAEDAERVTAIVRSCLEDIGMDPETGEFDADVVETGTSKSQRDRIRNLKGLIEEIEAEFDDGAPIDEVLDRAEEVGLDPSKAEDEIEKLRRKGEVYEPRQNHLRTT
jgi:replicative DNA helicase Mcm